MTASQTILPFTPAVTYSYISPNVGYNHVGAPNSPACQNAGWLFSFPASAITTVESICYWPMGL